MAAAICGSWPFVPSAIAVPAVAERVGIETAPLPLGSRDLSEKSTTEVLAAGLTHYLIQRGRPNNPAAAWTLEADIAFSADEVKRDVQCFATLHMASRTADFAIPFGGGVAYHVVAGGSFPSHNAAGAVGNTPGGCSLRPAHTAEEVPNQLGPWLVNILAIDPKRFTGRLSPILARAGELKRGELTSSMARHSGALAAINGGFFVEHERDGFPGEPAGVSLIAGQLMREPVAGRPVLIFTQAQAQPMRVADGPDWQIELTWDDGKATVVDGVNRKPGLVRNCGERGTRPTERPVHDFTCTRNDEIIYFPPGGAFELQTLPGARFALRKNGEIDALHPGEPIPVKDGVLVATGKRIEELQARISSGRRARLVTTSALLGDPSGSMSAVNAGPTLIRNGSLVRNEGVEGWAIDALTDADHRYLMHTWINRRQPRTAVGTRADGVILFVTVDGHRANTSVGVSIEELRQLMAHLGARDAVNLDGGGSTTMVIKGVVVNAPSDAAGERHVGDAILVLP